MPSPKCPSSAELADFDAGNLPRERLEVLALHVDACPECLSTLQALTSSSDTLLSELRRLGTAETFMYEPECREVVHRLLPTRAAQGVARGFPSETERPDSGATGIGRLGQYLLLEELGRGGMGTVYKARHLLLNRMVVLKVLPPARLTEPQAVARFRREMEAVGQLAHPNIIQADDAGEDGNTHFLVMEYVDGIDLSRLVERCGCLPIPEACELARQAALGLEHAHGQGLVHRDVKPSNLLLTPAGVVKVLDLGLALWYGEQPRSRQLTSSGEVMGTADYMAPEQAFDSHAVDIRADVYGLGCTLYKLLAGQAPFGGEKYKTVLKKLLAHARVQVTPIQQIRPDVPAELASVLERLLAKDPADRLATPGEVAQALTQFAAGSDLPTLWARAIREPTPAHASASTKPYILSGVTDTMLSETAMPGPAVLNEPRPGAPPTPSRDDDTASESSGPAAKALFQDPSPAAMGGFSRRRPVALWVAGAMGVAAVLLCLQIVVRIRDNQGRVTEVTAPPGSRVKVARDGPVEIDLPAGPDAKLIDSSPATSPGTSGRADVTTRSGVGELPRDVPLSPSALVSRPACLKGVLSWTIETRQHRRPVYAVSYSPCGRWLATGDGDGVVRIMRGDTAELFRLFVGSGPITARGLAWSPSKPWLASGMGDTVRVWDVETGQIVHDLRADNGRALAAAWSPDGAILASGHQRGQIRLWELVSLSPPRTLQVNDEAITALAWSPDGKTLASGGWGPGLVLWDVARGRARANPSEQTGRVYSICFSPDGRTLASGNDTDRTVRLWEAESGRLLSELLTSKHIHPTVAWSPDGKLLARTNDKDIALVDVETGDVVGTLEGHTDLVRCLSWTPDGKTLASTSADDGTVRTWDVGAGQCRSTIEKISCRATAAAWSPDGKYLALAGRQELVQLWDTASALAPRLPETATPLTAEALAWSPDKSTPVLACAGADGQTRLWDLRSGTVRTLRGGGTHRLSSIAWSADGKRIAAGGPDRRVRVWDTGDGNLLQELQCFAPVSAVVWLPGSLTLAASSTSDATGESMVYLWDQSEGGQTRSFSAHKGFLWGLACAPHGATLATSSHDGTVRLWDVQSAEPVRTLSANFRVFGMAWSPDGRTMVAAGPDGTGRAWSAESGRVLYDFRWAQPGLVEPVCVTFSPDSCLFALTAIGHPVELVETKTGRGYGVIISARKGQGLAIARDGHYRGNIPADELFFCAAEDPRQETFTAQEFAAKHGWQNDPGKVLLALETWNE